MTSPLPPLTQALTGALGGAASNVLTYPLDTLCARIQTAHRRHAPRGVVGALQLLRKIAAREGWDALYGGLTSDTAATLISNFFYFYAYTALRALALRQRARRLAHTSTAGSSKTQLAAAAQLLPVSLELVLGFVAGVASRALSTPLAVVTVRLQTGGGDSDDGDGSPARVGEKGKSPERPRRIANPISVVKEIYASDGLKGFWKGFHSTVLLSLNPALTFALFQLFRRALALLAHRPGGPAAALTTKPGPLESFAAAAVSNSAAVALLYPLILAKTRLQSAAPYGPSSAPKPRGTSALMGTLAKIHQKGGLAALYQGLEAQLFKAFVNQGVSFLIKERIEQALLLLLAVRNAAT